MTDEQIDVVSRLIQFTLYKSMNQLRDRVKSEFVSRGWKEELKKFKLKQNGKEEIEILLNPRYL